MNQIKKHTIKNPIGMMFEELFNRSINEVMGVDQSRTIPYINIMDTETSYVIELAASGLTKEDIEISAEGDALVIESNATKDKEVVGKILRKEFDFSTFKRSFTLSDDVDKEGIVATYTDGILRVTLSKLPADVVNKVKRIAIS